MLFSYVLLDKFSPLNSFSLIKEFFIVIQQTYYLFLSFCLFSISLKVDLFVFLSVYQFVSCLTCQLLYSYGQFVLVYNMSGYDSRLKGKVVEKDMKFHAIQNKKLPTIKHQINKIIRLICQFIFPIFINLNLFITIIRRKKQSYPIVHFANMR